MVIRICFFIIWLRLVILACRDLPADKEAEICDCFGTSIEKIRDFKDKEYPINTPDGTEDRSCTMALAKSSPLVKKQYNRCVDALRGKSHLEIFN